MKKNTLLFFIGSLSFFPFVAFGFTTLGTTLDMFLSVTLSLINIFGTLAFVVFFYGLALFLLNQEDKNANEKGKNIMVWGVVALFVLITIWGIIGFMQNTLGNYDGPQGVNIEYPRV
ncbi:MAG: hypothetical protein NT098_00875 [Candidatus Parcubacteria bacterium]|nr:hypothetical protein [Candidatus Parcubacteria bacterium]